MELAFYICYQKALKQSKISFLKKRKSFDKSHGKSHCKIIKKVIKHVCNILLTPVKFGSNINYQDV